MCVLQKDENMPCRAVLLCCVCVQTLAWPPLAAAQPPWSLTWRTSMSTNLTHPKKTENTSPVIEIGMMAGNPCSLERSREQCSHCLLTLTCISFSRCATLPALHRKPKESTSGEAAAASSRPQIAWQIASRAAPASGAASRRRSGWRRGRRDGRPCCPRRGLGLGHVRASEGAAQHGSAAQ